MTRSSRKTTAPSRLRRAALTALAALTLAGAAVPALAAPTLLTIWDFRSKPTDGSRPQGAIYALSPSEIYVATPGGGSNHIGAVFILKAKNSPLMPWRQTNVYNAAPSSAGNFPSDVTTIQTTLSPRFWPVLVTDNYGGTHDKGAIAEIIPSQPGETPGVTNAVRYSFGSSGLDGWYPNTPLSFGGSFAVGPNIFLDYYGIAIQGGSGSCGTVFNVESPVTGFYAGGGAWTEGTVYAFAGGNDGCLPTSLLMEGNGTLQSNQIFGTTLGGANGAGLVFSIARASVGSPWVKSTLYTFAGGSDGDSPTAGLIELKDGSLVGTTQKGGNGCGTVFQLLRPAAGQTQWTERLLHAFTDSPDGCEPLNGVVQDNHGNLYGVTFAGGDMLNPLGNPQGGEGTIFELTQTDKKHHIWSESVLWRFAGVDGSNPGSSLVLYNTGSGVSLLGTTNYSGKYSGGTAYWFKN